MSKKFVFTLDEDEVVIRVSEQLHEAHCVAVSFRPTSEFVRKANQSLKLESKMNYSYLLINSLSHELITPIGQILANANSILREREEGPAALEQSQAGKASQKRIERPGPRADFQSSVSKIKQLSMGIDRKSVV